MQPMLLGSPVEVSVARQYRANPEVIFCEVDDGAVLLSSSDEVYFGLNEVGAKVWSLLPPSGSGLDDLCDKVCRDYPDADRSVVCSDVEELLEQLVSHGLLVSEAA